MPSICAVCNGACCRSLPFDTAKNILADISQYNPDAMNCMERILHPDDSGKTVCAFFAEEEGCVLKEVERPFICEQLKCDLFLLAERDPQLAEFCLDNGHIIMTDPFQNKYTVLCDPACGHKDKCLVPCRLDVTQ